MPDEPLEDAVYVTTTEQLRAVNNLVRHRILAVLRDGPATITQVAERLGLAKGSSSYHMRLLERAGLIRVLSTRKVRGVFERYYGHTARKIILPDPVEGQPDVLMRHALADLEQAPVGGQRFVRLTHSRISEEKFAEFEARLAKLTDELKEESDPGTPMVTLAIALFRPQEGESK